MFEFVRFFALVFVLPYLFFALVANAETKSKPARPIETGWLEVGYLLPDNAKIKTKLDTGALTSSLHALGIRYLEKDGKPWVKFRTPIVTKAGKYTAYFELPVLQTTKIKEHKGESATRYVVEMSLCLGKRHYTFPVTLANRSRFNYELILGRSMMKGNFIVNPNKTFSIDSECQTNDLQGDSNESKAKDPKAKGSKVKGSKKHSEDAQGSEKKAAPNSEKDAEKNKDGSDDHRTHEHSNASSSANTNANTGANTTKEESIKLNKDDH